MELVKTSSLTRAVGRDHLRCRLYAEMAHLLEVEKMHAASDQLLSLESMHRFEHYGHQSEVA